MVQPVPVGASYSGKAEQMARDATSLALKALGDRFVLALARTRVGTRERCFMSIVIDFALATERVLPTESKPVVCVHTSTRLPDVFVSPAVRCVVRRRAFIVVMQGTLINGNFLSCPVLDDQKRFTGAFKLRSSGKHWAEACVLQGSLTCWS
jgi:hypothetical protein